VLKSFDPTSVGYFREMNHRKRQRGRLLPAVARVLCEFLLPSEEFPQVEFFPLAFTIGTTNTGAGPLPGCLED